MAFDADGAIQAAHIDFVSDMRRVPDAVARDAGRGRRHAVPGPVPRPHGRLPTKSVYTNTVGRTGYRGPWQFETLAREVLARHRGRRDGHGPRRAAAPQPAARDDMPYTNPNGMPLRQHLAARDVRAGVGDARLRGVPRRAGRRPPRRPVPRASACPTTSSRRRPARALRDRGGDDPHRTVGHGQRVRRGRLGGNSLETTVVQLTADALGVDIEDVNTIQGDTALTGFGAAPAGAGAAR